MNTVKTIKEITLPIALPTNRTSVNCPVSSSPATAMTMDSSTISLTANFSDKVYESGLCRGGIEPDVCSSCLGHSSSLLSQVWPNNKEAIAGFDECMLHFSNRSSFGLMETHPRFYSWNTQKVASNCVNSFFRKLITLLDDLKSQALAGGSFCKYATGNISTSTACFRTIYALVQCMPDLSQLDCQNCLDEVFGDVPPYYVRVGGRVVTPSCNFRYEVYLFYGRAYESLSTAQLSGRLPSAYTAAIQGKRRNKFEISFVVVPSTVVLLVLSIFLGIYSRVKKENKSVETQSDLQLITFRRKIRSEKVPYLVLFTGVDFVVDNIFVKRFCEHGSYREYFKNEVKLSSKLQHRNLVKLLGFCLEGNERSLVYEFVPTSLDLLIFDVDPLKVMHTYLGWDRRYNIIRGIARGLLYLHEDSGLTIIHSDIRASKILLDEELNPKIFGFERAELIDDIDQNEDASIFLHVSSSLKGYLAPKLLQGGQISMKADVFSFGVLLLEIVTGQRSYKPLCQDKPDEDQEPTLILTAWRNWMDGTASDHVDPQIKDGNGCEIMRCVHIGLLCVQENKDVRPTMNSVVLMLGCDSFPLPVPSRPGSFQEISRNELIGPSSSSDFNARVSESSDENFATSLRKKILYCFPAKGWESMS